MSLPCLAGSLRGDVHKNGVTRVGEWFSVSDMDFEDQTAEVPSHSWAASPSLLGI